MLIIAKNHHDVHVCYVSTSVLAQPTRSFDVEQASAVTKRRTLYKHFCNSSRTAKTKTTQESTSIHQIHTAGVRLKEKRYIIMPKIIVQM